MNIVDACRDPELFGPWFKVPATWAPWWAFLAALFALPMDDAVVALFTNRPMNVPTQIIAKATPASRAKAPTVGQKPLWAPQPTSRPVIAITVMPSEPSTSVANTLPPSTDTRLIGSERKRSITPSRISFDTPTAVVTDMSTIG